jgi:hypothetical protein
MAYTKTHDTDLLQAALIGYERQLTVVQERMAEIRREIGGERGRSVEEGESKPKRGMSAAGRARVAAAQRQRWAALKRSNKGSAATVKPKRKMSAAGRKRIIEATRKRWAAWRAEKANAAK